MYETMNTHGTLSIASPNDGMHEARKRKDATSLPTQVFKKPYTPPQTPTSEDTAKSYQERVLGSNLAASKSSWEAAIQNDELHADKTATLKLIWEDHFSVYYISRPPMSGKTWFVDMAQYFFEIAKEESTLVAKRTLFKELLLGHVNGGQKFIDDHCGQYITIRISFKNMKTDTIDVFYKGLIDIFSKIYKQWEDEIIGHEKAEIKPVASWVSQDLIRQYNKMQEDGELYYVFLKKLLQYLYCYYNKQCIVIFDDFDHLIFSCKEVDVRMEITRKMMWVIHAVMKAHNVSYTKKVYIFGTIPFDVNSILGSVDNIHVYDFTHFTGSSSESHNGFQEAFRFSENEVVLLIEKIIPKAHYTNERLIDEAITIARKHYSKHYDHRDARVYNQSTIMRYLRIIKDAEDDLLSGKCTIELLAKNLLMSQRGKIPIKDIAEETPYVPKNIIVELVKDYNEQQNNPNPELKSANFVEPYFTYGLSKDSYKHNDSNIPPNADELVFSELECVLMVHIINALISRVLTPDNKIIIPNLAALGSWVQLLGHSFENANLIADGLDKLVRCDYAGFSKAIRDIIHSSSIKAGSGQKLLPYHDLMYVSLMLYGLHPGYFIESETLTGAGNHAIALIPRGTRNTGFMIKLECMPKPQEEVELENELKMLSIEEADHSQNNNGYFYIFGQYEKVVKVTEAAVTFHDKEYSVSVRQLEKTSKGWEYQNLATDPVETLRGSLA
ncbi:hypothetical protein H4219_005766 [Mycoemilia scoparia]|uniref:AAA-ATPase-like domain-containing protein n=1 Tax=Mycoemilia scoparia TaxID=417184 RepID=A0A9W7ZN23_9FUNG|nr:hypothetical protein H4219_005766 [Mycoemilia scoparia]